MAIRTVQNSFVSGELSPELWGRHDLKAYFSGAAKIKDMVVRRTGGARKRQGTDLLLDLTDYPGCRLIPFFYDRATSFILMFHGQKLYVIGKNAAGAYDFLKHFTGEVGSSGYYAFGIGIEWEIYSIATQFADKDLPGLRHYQAGDTVFLTCPGYQACKLVRMSDLSWSISYMTGAVTVPVPGAMTASPSGFHDVTDNYPASRLDYALFAVKGGVASAPRKVSAATSLPWIAGAQVALSFTPDLASGVDGYYIGKKSGSYYGMLAELWPTREAVSLTSPAKTYASSGISALAWTTSWLLSDNHATDLRVADPSVKEATEIKMLVNRFAFHVPRGADGWSTAEFYRSTSFTVGRVRVFFGARTADASRQNVVSPDYSAAPPTVKVAHLSGTTWVTDYEGAPPTAESSGYAEFTIGYTGSVNRIRVSVANASGSDTGVVLRGISIINRSSVYVSAGAWTLGGTATAYVSRGVTGRTDSATYYTATYLDANSGAEESERGQTEAESCTPLRYLKPHPTPMALTLYDSGGGVMAGAVKLTAAAHFAVNEIRVYPGALTAGLPLYTPGTIQEHTSNTDGAKILYTLNGTDWLALTGTFAIADQYGDNPVSIQVPESTDAAIKDAAVGWGLALIAKDPTKPVLVRGVQFFATTVVSTFVDQNHTPGKLIDAQSYIAPGSSDMDCDVMGVWQQRTVLAAAPGLPFSMWFSTVGDLTNWYANRPMTDADAFSVSIPATTASKILHLMTGRRMMVFTESGVYVVEGSESEGFGYRTCRITEACGTGACAVPPVGVRSSALYVAADGRTLTELKYDLAEDGLKPIDRSVLAAHMTEASNVARLAWQAAPDGVLWVLLASGELLSFTFLPDHEVYAWSRHAVARGECRVLDVVAPGSINEEQADNEGAGDVFLLVDDGTRVTLERLRPPVSSDSPTLAAAVCLDRMQVVSFAAAGNEILPAVFYPEGTALAAVSLDTGEVRAAVANAATVTLAGAVVTGRWAVGYPVSGELDTLRPEMPDRNVQGIAKNVTDMLVRVRRSGSVAVRPTAGGLAAVAVPPATAAESGRVALYSGDLKVSPRGYINTHGGITLTAAGPWPAEILCLVQTIQIGDA